MRRSHRRSSAAIFRLARPRASRCNVFRIARENLLELFLILLFFFLRRTGRPDDQLIGLVSLTEDVRDLQPVG